MFNLINQGAQPNVGKSDFGLLDLPLPPRPEQKKMAEILSEVDKKIEEENTISKELQNL